MRVALYYTPSLNDPLWNLGARWLGRDTDTNAPVPQPDIANIAEVTADARMYGFHATLKPPMTLLPGVTWDRVVTETEDLAATLTAFDLPQMAVADLHGFLALRETEPSADLQTLADACVKGLDHLRAPPTDAELERRRRSTLNPEQAAMLMRWGYPYVFSTWFFHMTLTRRLTPSEHELYRPAAEAMFQETLKAPRRVVDISLCVQASPGAPFILAERLPLG
jgi:putative phosphonate metabolism protein